MFPVGCYSKVFLNLIMITDKNILAIPIARRCHSHPKWKNGIGKDINNSQHPTINNIHTEIEARALKLDGIIVPRNMFC